jgi:putative ABC transport system permease protein
MKTRDLIFREFIRRRNRTILVVSVIAFAVALTVAVRSLAEATHEATRHELVRFGANIRVQAEQPGNMERRGGFFVDTATIPEATAEQVRETPHADMLRAVAPRLSAHTSLDDIPVNLVGVSPDERLLRIWWRVDKTLLRDHHVPRDNRVLVGSRLYSRLGQPAAINLEKRVFAVAGVLDPTGDGDDESVFLDLSGLQELVGMPGAVHTVEVASGCIACKDMDVYDHAREIREALTGVGGSALRIEAVRKIAEAQIGTLRMVERAALGISILILVLAGLLVASDLLARVQEQRRELAILRAVGMPRWRLAVLLLARGTLLGVFGALVGVVIGAALSLVLGPIMVGMPAPPSVDVLFAAPIVAVLVAICASLGPALKGARLPLSTVLAEEA